MWWVICLPCFSHHKRQICLNAHACSCEWYLEASEQGRCSDGRIGGPRSQQEPTRGASCSSASVENNGSTVSQTTSSTSAPSSTSTPLCSPALLSFWLYWLRNRRLPVVIEWKIHWLLFKGELRWYANGLPRVQPVFIYRGSKHRNIWLRAWLLPFSSAVPQASLTLTASYISPHAVLIILSFAAYRMGVLLPWPKEKNKSSLITSYLLSSARSIIIKWQR